MLKLELLMQGCAEHWTANDPTLKPYFETLGIPITPETEKAFQLGIVVAVVCEMEGQQGK